MGNFLRPYLEHRSEEPQPANEHRLWVTAQPNKGTFTEPGATDVLLITSHVSPDNPRVQHENEEFRQTRSPGAMIQGVRPAVEVTAGEATE